MATKETPRFDLIGAITKSIAASDGAAPKLFATSSSSEADLSGDVMSANALLQMKQQFVGKTIFLNHSYSVPNDVAGKCIESSLVQRDGFTDLDLVIEVNTANPRALETLDAIANGISIGVSVGVLVDKAHFAKDANGDKFLQIDSVRVLESSLVGIPSSQRSFVNSMLKAASYSAYGIPWRDDTDDDDITPANSSELEVAKSVVSLLLAGLKQADQRITERDTILADLVKALDVVYDAPLPRKTADVFADNISAIAQKHGGWLDERIIAQLGRTN